MGKSVFLGYNKWISPHTNMTPETLVPTPRIPALLEWRAPSRINNERSPRWYMITGIAVLVIAAYGIISGAWTVSVVAVLCGSVYVLLRDHVPTLRSISITEQGVNFEGTFYGYNDLRSFWLIKTEVATILHITQKKRGGDIVLLTGLTDPELVRQVLSRFLTEESDHKEHLLDTFIRICKL